MFRVARKQGCFKNVKEIIEQDKGANLKVLHCSTWDNWEENEGEEW